MSLAPVQSQPSQIALDFVAGRASMSTTLVSLAQGAARVAGINELESTVSADPDFSLRVLALANSAFYSPLHEVTSLRGALIALGADTVQKLAANLLARSLLATPSKAGAGLWLHSQAVSLTAQMLAETHRRVDPQQAFVAGLLHDVGLLASLSCDANSQTAIAEHGALGGEIADLLGLSPALSSVIRCHDDTVLEQLVSRPLNATVYIANVIASRRGFGHESEPPEDCEAATAVAGSLGLQPADIERLGNLLPERLEDLQASMGEFAETSE
ncbi:MAG: HDOD domain-containing protein [Pseudomonadota bacterium]